MAKRILITGDSFGCEWPGGEGIGWPLILSETHAVNNLAQAGVGEYKILKQLHDLSAHDSYWVNNYDCVIIKRSACGVCDIKCFARSVTKNLLKV